MGKGCLKISQLLDAYVDNELSRDKLEWVKGHLGLCGECNAELNSIYKLRGLLKGSLKEAKLPDFVMAHYWKGVEAKIYARGSFSLAGLIAKLFPSPTLTFSLGVLATLLLVLTVSVPLMSKKGKEISPQQATQISMNSLGSEVSCVVKSIKAVNPNSSVMVLPNQGQGQMTIIWVFGLKDEEKRVKEEETRCSKGENVLM